MSQAKNRLLAERWLQTAEEDLRAAGILRDGGAYPQACFYCQQAGEKAVKSLWYLADRDPWGHSVQRLVMELPLAREISDYNLWHELAALLDKFYIPTRYPNGLPDLTPGQVYQPKDADAGLHAAQMLIEACKKEFTKTAR